MLAEMDLKQQVKSLRDTAFQLSLTGEGVWHAESGVRGNAITADLGQHGCASESPSTLAEASQRRDCCDFRRPILERAYREVMRRFLCADDQSSSVVMEPWRTFGFAFAAAGSGCAQPTVKQEEDLDGIGHSFIYGDRPSLERLGRLIAMPAVRYMSSVSSHGWVRESSWDDMETALGDWVYIIYEIGLKTRDPNLRRFYRFLVPFDGSVVGSDDDLLVGFDGYWIHKNDIRQRRIRQIIWQAAERREIAFARLGTDLTLASRIALDYLLDLKMEKVSDGFHLKWEDHSRFDWAKQVELVRATNQVIGAGTLDKGSLSNAVTKEGKIKYNGNSGRACRVNVESFLIWIARKEKLQEDEVTQIRNAIIGEINSRK